MRVKQGKDRRNKERPYVVRWADGIDLDTGKVKWHQESFRYKLDANEFAAAKRLEKPGKPVDSNAPMRLGQFLKECCKIRNDKRAGTCRIDDQNARRMLNHFGADTPLSDIRPLEAARFIQDAKRLDDRPGPLSKSTRSCILRNLHALFGLAVDWKLIDENPFHNIASPTAEAKDWHYLRPAEFHAVLTASKGRNTVPLRYKAIYALAYCCGLRLGEILSLRWDENIIVSKDHAGGFSGEVYVKNQPAHGDDPPFLIKNYEARNITIPQKCLEILLDLQSYGSMTSDGSPYVVLNASQYKTLVARWRRCQHEGKDLPGKDFANNVLSTFRRHCQWAGIQPRIPVTLHDLRKACITGWANSINNPEVVRKLAGHKDIATTMKYYSKVTEEERQKAADSTDKLLDTPLSATGASGMYED